MDDLATIPVYNWSVTKRARHIQQRLTSSWEEKQKKWLELLVRQRKQTVERMM